MKKLPEKGIAFLSKDPSVQRAASGQNMGKFQQHVFQRRPQGLRILEVNLKLPLKLSPGQCISPGEGTHPSFSGLRAAPRPGLFTDSWSSGRHPGLTPPFKGHCVLSGSFLLAPWTCDREGRAAQLRHAHC